MSNVLIIGAGGVAHVVAHKCAQNNDILGNISIASRNLPKCYSIIESTIRKGSIKDQSKSLLAYQLNAHDILSTVRLIEKTQSDIVINVGPAFINMDVLSACLMAGVSYMDTAIHEEPDKVCENPPWYGNYEWKRKEECSARGINAILGIGFDPGVVNAYCAYALKHFFDKIDTIDILDVNAGCHGKYFATNFDPEINFREFIKAWIWSDRQWVCLPMHSIKRNYEFPVLGKHDLYLGGHDELHSLSKNINARSIRFWMSFGDHYIKCFNVLKNIGMLSHLPVKLDDGRWVIPLKVLKAVLPDPKTLAQNYAGKTCIGNLIRGEKDGRYVEKFIYNICDHKENYEEVESQAISYTAGVPATAAAILLAKGVWKPKTMVNVEELDPDPLLNLLDTMGLKTEITEANFFNPDF